MSCGKEFHIFDAEWEKERSYFIAQNVTSICAKVHFRMTLKKKNVLLIKALTNWRCTKVSDY